MGSILEMLHLTLLLQTISTRYPLMDESITLKMNDMDTPLGTSLQDERWVYDNPNIPFMSTANKTAIPELVHERIERDKRRRSASEFTIGC